MCRQETLLSSLLLNRALVQRMQKQDIGLQSKIWGTVLNKAEDFKYLYK